MEINLCDGKASMKQIIRAPWLKYKDRSSVAIAWAESVTGLNKGLHPLGSASLSPALNSLF